MSGESMATTRNWYMEEYFGEDKIKSVGEWFNGAVMIVAVVLAFVGPVL
jgi:hypothetical protein